jgi:DNA-3-methyladenine glycosylase II
MAETAVAHLSAADPVMRRMIEAIGPFSLKPHRNRFRVLVRAIISQQISTSAARSILARLEETLERDGLTPEALARLSPQRMRRAGLSPQKQAYLKDLAARVVRGDVELHRFGRMPDDEVIAELTQVKGIGVWTAQMFLIFTLGRPNIFPHADLGVRTAIQRAYQLAELPNKEEALRIAETWHPYATVGSWYCWRILALPTETWRDPLPSANEMKSGRAASR